MKDCLKLILVWLTLLMLVTVLVACDDDITMGSVGTTVPSSTSTPITESATTAPETTVPPTSSAAVTTAPEKPSMLQDVLAGMTNYTATLVIAEEGEVWLEEIYRVSNGNVQFTYEDLYGDSYTEYFAVKNGEMIYYYDGGDGNFYAISNKETCFAEFDSASYHGLTLLEGAAFEEKDGVYRYIGQDVNTLCKVLFDDYDDDYGKEVFSSLTLYTENGKATKLTAQSTYTDEDGSYRDDYTVTFSAIGSTAAVTLPKNAITVTDENYDSIFEGGESGGNTGDNTGDDNNTTEDERQYDYLIEGIPATGQVKALVLPVQFSNDTFTPKELADLEKAFGGSSADTGWYSVAGFYAASSYGKLTLDFTVADVYSTSLTTTAFLSAYGDYYGNYENNLENLDPIEEIIDEILKKLDKTIDLSDYDSNRDGYIDAIYLIYSAPLSYETDGSYAADLWWSWQTLSYSDTAFDDTYTGKFVWSSIDTLYESTDNDLAIVDFKLNTTTWIHETGHMLSLEDYYDYDTEKGPAGGVGGGDLMDSAVGDHGAFSKYQLDWVTPIEVAGDGILTIGGLSKTGDCLIIRKDPSDKDPYGEYLLIDLYLPDGVNAPFNGECGLPTTAAVRIFHVNADFYKTIDEDGYAIGGFVYNNTDTEVKLLKLLEQDGNRSIENTDNFSEGEYAVDSDYYGKGDSLPTSYTWADGTRFAFTLTVTALANGQATIQVDFH